MIISPPVLTLNENLLDENWVNSILPFESPENEYPVLDTLAWHGGYHLKADGNNNVARAIADGKVIYARKDTDLVDYDGTKSNKGCVVIEHETEIGKNVAVKFYSIYMHLRNVDSLIDKGRKVNRKQKLGLIGQHRNENKMHFEIVCDQSNLEKIIGRSTPELNLSSDGRKDAVYGDIHFYLPSGTKFYSDRNTTNEVLTSTSPLFIGLHFNNGKAYTQTYKEIGNGIFTKIGTPLLVKYILGAGTKNQANKENYEYDLYEFSSENAMGAAAHSAVFELFRFGRILDTTLEPSNISSIQHWHKVSLPDNKEGFVNLNTSAIKKFSDGDFPHWVGWRLFNDDSTLDSQCNSAKLKSWLDDNHDKINTNVELKSMLGNAEVKARLGKAICQFPTEWSESLVDSQYSWVITKSAENTNPLSQDDFIKFKQYVKALSFWDQIPELPAKDKVWHFHPREFIKHFRKCLWLSLSELKQIVPSHAMRKSGKSYLWERVDLNTKSTSAIVSLRLDLNIACRKYFINTPYRLISFLGNAIQESQWLSKMYENNKTQRYYPWDGRGYLQLTWASNYLSYWEFKGRNVPANAKQALREAERLIKTDRNNVHYANAENSLTADMKTWRDRVGQNGENISQSRESADSAGFYWAFFNMASFADKSYTLEKVTINTDQKNQNLLS